MTDKLPIILSSSSADFHEPNVELSRGILKSYPETRARVDILCEGILRDFNLPVININETSSLSVWEKVHSRTLLNELETLEALARLRNSYIHPYPVGLYEKCCREIKEWLGINGIESKWVRDCSSPLGPVTLEACRNNAMVVGNAFDLLRESPNRPILALIRPPGHHAGRDKFGSYCYLNSVALAATLFMSKGSVGVLDIDLHHGNGTQEIFWGSQKIFCSSVHEIASEIDPWYPFTGQKETKSPSNNVTNYPLRKNASNDEWVSEVHIAVKELESKKIEGLVVALGFDALMGEPHSQMKVTPEAFRLAGKLIRRLNVPTLFVLEGGYSKLIGNGASQLVEGIINH